MSIRLKDSISGNISGNASSATKLQNTRTINGTNFNGTANITTALWGTARNISIASSDGTNASSSKSVNGSDNDAFIVPGNNKVTSVEPLTDFAELAPVPSELAIDIFLAVPQSAVVIFAEPLKLVLLIVLVV